MKQIIIVRKDLNMSKGKMAAQVAHASMAFLTNQLRENSKKVFDCYKEYVPYDRNGKFISHYFFDHNNIHIEICLQLMVQYLHLMRDAQNSHRNNFHQN